MDDLTTQFADRAQAGRLLGERLRDLRLPNVVVLALPRGGVPVAAEVAKALRAPLDIIVVRKLGVPRQPELAMGAIGEDDVRVLNPRVLSLADVSDDEIDTVERRERAELERRAARFRAVRERVPLRGRTALIVDDGIATGSTVRAAVAVARAHEANRVVIATPVAPPDTAASLREVADDLIVLHEPRQFFAVGEFYRDFTQTTDDEVVRVLAEAKTRPSSVDEGVDEEVEVVIGDVRLGGHLTVPSVASPVVLFAHGSGSSRHSPRNQYVASVLNAAGLGTLLFDLLTVDEARDRANVFDIAFLAERLVGATNWLRAHDESASPTRIGYFGASTGAGAALWAAADPRAEIAAVVSRGGRPDLAQSRLGAVRAPTLLIVGGNDTEVLALNRDAQSRLHCENRLSIVPGASHLFEEPGTLEMAAQLARDWFVEHVQ